MAFNYLKVKSAKCLRLLPVVLVLVSWSWSCKQRSLSWSWSCYFGVDLGLGLKNLVLFASLVTSVFTFHVVYIMVLCLYDEIALQIEF